jgi:hypothetical protein
MNYRILPIPLILLSLSITAQAEPLKVKPGLWETTTTTESRQANKPTNLDRLTPEQRDKVEKKLEVKVKKETKTVQACLSEAQIKSGDTFLGKTHQANCKRTFQTQTASDLAATLECDGVNSMTGRVEMHAADPEHMSGTVNMTYGAAGSLQMKTHSSIQARWLTGDCKVPVGTSGKTH